MSADPDKRQTPSPGLRERKKLKTREAIQRAALRLFARQGYEKTTVEDIADAAEISPSTFFNYFPTKEDVVMYDMYDPMALQMIAGAPKDESLNSLTRRIMGAMSQVLEQDKEMILGRAHLLLAVPELRSRIADEVERTNELFVKALAQRSGRRADDFELRVATRILVAAIYEATIEWMRSNGRESLSTLAERALDVMEGGAALTAAAGKQRAARTARKTRRVRRSV